MEFRYVQVPNFHIMEKGKQVELRCKLCGAVIAGLTNRLVKRDLTRDGRVVEQFVEKFQHFHNYVEVKIVFNDGSAHVTNGCSGCLNEGMPLAVLKELYVADVMAVDGEGYRESDLVREPQGIIAISRDQRGIV